jgi:tetratricopeptide (TPR) repeat protein
LLEAAIADYQSAARYNPFDPTFAVNEASLLSELARDDQAEEKFRLATQLQGGMEPCFRSHFAFANHYLRKSIRIFDPKEPHHSLDALELAAEQMEIAVKEMHWVTPDFHAPRAAIHQNLGIAREAAGDREGAQQVYDFTSNLQNGQSAHYLAGVLIGKQAVEAWSKRRPSEALTLFMQAKQRLQKAGNALPEGVTLSQRAEYLAYLDETIAFLKGAKVEPLK